MKRLALTTIALTTLASSLAYAEKPTSPVVDTNQRSCYDNTKAMHCPTSDAAYYGQDAQYQGYKPSYTDNGDGTITDKITGLMWIKDAGTQIQYSEAMNKTKNFSYAGYNDWRIPTIKELYSLMDFNGIDIMPTLTGSSGLTPFINTRYFDFEYGDTKIGQRIIDSQWITSSIYKSKVMGNQQCFFGVNFADGRIKCYPTKARKNGGWFLRMVRGNPTYGKNSFTDNNDGSITDSATGLTWQKSDSREGMKWVNALSYCENLELAGKDDWRLPNAKELQSIVDYSRSPDTTDSAAIDPIFSASTITNEKGTKDWPFYWTGTTHKSMTGMSGGVYISFGRAMGNMKQMGWIDVHGAGAQRSDPKSGTPNKDGHGPQGDAQRVNNYVRCVRDGAYMTLDTTFDTYKTQSPPSRYNQEQGSSQNSHMPPEGNRRQPPQEALRACSSKSSGNSCSFTSPRGKISGTCRQVPGGNFACVPR